MTRYFGILIVFFNTGAIPFKSYGNNTMYDEWIRIHMNNDNRDEVQKYKKFI